MYLKGMSMVLEARLAAWQRELLCTSLGVHNVPESTTCSINGEESHTDVGLSLIAIVLFNPWHFGDLTPDIWGFNPRHKGI